MNTGNVSLRMQDLRFRGNTKEIEKDDYIIVICFMISDDRRQEGKKTKVERTMAIFSIYLSIPPLISLHCNLLSSPSSLRVRKIVELSNGNKRKNDIRGNETER